MNPVWTIRAGGAAHGLAISAHHLVRGYCPAMKQGVLMGEGVIGLVLILIIVIDLRLPRIDGHGVELKKGLNDEREQTCWRKAPAL
jgi:hypothetical protein